MAITDNSFSKCSVSLGTDIARCGSVTACTPLPIEASELATVYGTDPAYRVMDGLLKYEFEIGQCGVEQKGLPGFLMANKVTKNIESTRVQDGTIMVMPFITAKAKSIINNEYWSFTGGNETGSDGGAGTGYWTVTATSPTSVPASAGWFNVGDRVYVNSRTDAGSQTTTAYSVTARTVSGTTVIVTLLAQNSASYLPSSRTTDAVTGFLARGTANISDFESYCYETPGLNNNKLVPFWVETIRQSMCRSEMYNRFRRLLADNPLFQMFGQIPETELNRQQGEDFKKRWMNNVMWGKRLNTNQTMDLYRALPSITIPAGSIVTAGGDMGSCIGRRANTVGFYEQHAECSRVVDLQNGQINLPALFESLRIMSRVREAHGSKASMNFDIFTDEVTAAQFRIAMFSYYKAYSQEMLQMHINLGAGQPKVAPMGFAYSSYPLIFPSGVTINILTDRAFDDLVTMASSVNMASIGRYLWILDWSSNYVGTLASNKKVWGTQDLATMARFDPTLACVMEMPSRTTTLFSQTYAAISECPAGDLIISNFSGVVPEAVNNAATVYGS